MISDRSGMIERGAFRGRVVSALTTRWDAVRWFRAEIT